MHRHQGLEDATLLCESAFGWTRLLVRVRQEAEARRRLGLAMSVPHTHVENTK